MDDAKNGRQARWISLGLLLVVLAAYNPLLGAGFINWNDAGYVTDNSHVQAGLTWPNLQWAFASFEAGYWHPLTWLSHMLDCQLYGLKPAGHHLTSVLLHAANSILLFLLLRKLTGEVWPSALAAGFFALHPLHVESVAWISERKDVLCAFFWLLSLHAYARYTREARDFKFQISNFKFYVVSLLCFLAALMSKPMAVTLPLTLLLLDYWPLKRLRPPLSRLQLAEKAPFFGLTAVFCVFTFLAVQQAKAVMDTASLTLGARAANAVVSCARYLQKTVWPVHLAVAYPLFAWPDWMIAGAVAWLLLLTGLAVWQAKRRPWLAMGWFWFVATLAPVLGLIQVGMHSMADRYTYMPGIGLWMALAWGAKELALRVGAKPVVTLALLVLGLCGIQTHCQTGYWKDSGTLFTHAIKVTPQDYIAYERLAAYEEAHGQTNAALRDLETAVAIQPKFPLTLDKLGQNLMKRGRMNEAMTNFQAAISLDPRLSDTHYDLGYALLAKRQVAEALDQFQTQVNLEPDNFKAELNMGTVLLQNGLSTDAVPYLSKATQLNPTDPSSRSLLGQAFYRSGKAAEAVAQLEEAIKLAPDDLAALNDLAWILACTPSPSLRNGVRAVELASQAEKFSGGTNAVIIGTLAAAFAESGKFPDAIVAERRACELAKAQADTALLQSLEKRLSLYHAGSPWHDSATPAQSSVK